MTKRIINKYVVDKTKRHIMIKVKEIYSHEILLYLITSIIRILRK